MGNSWPRNSLNAPNVWECLEDVSRGGDFAGHTDSMQFRNGEWAGLTQGIKRRILEDVEIADSGSLALLSKYAPVLGGDTLMSGYWQETWPEMLPSDSSSALVSVFEPPSFLSPFESLVQLDFSNVGNQRGENLVQLLDARATLDAVEVAVGSCLNNWTVPSVFRGQDGAHAGFELTTEAALGYFDLREPAPFYSCDSAILGYIILAEQIREALVRFQARARNFRVRISCGIRSLKKAFACVFRNFCGLSWAHRAWYIMHGSHPPKTGRWHFDCQPFGCARTLSI